MAYAARDEPAAPPIRRARSADDARLGHSRAATETVSHASLEDDEVKLLAHGVAPTEVFLRPVTLFVDVTHLHDRKVRLDHSMQRAQIGTIRRDLAAECHRSAP